MVELVYNHDSGNAIIKFLFRYQYMSLTEYDQDEYEGKRFTALYGNFS